MEYFKTDKLTENITVISGVTNEKMFLVEGRERACLVDAGIGYGNLSEYVKGLTRLPVTVLLTHGHLDHTGGCAGFGEIYIDRADAEVFRKSYTKEAAYDYICEIVGRETAAELPADLLCEELPKNVKYYEEDQTFDLGGIRLQILPCGGHTPGSVAVLICEERKLILGDACNRATYLFGEEALSVKEYRENLSRLRQREAEWDEVLFSHYEVSGSKEIVGEVLHVCDEVLAGRADPVPYTFMGRNGYIAMRVKNTREWKRVDGRVGNMIYQSIIEWNPGDRVKEILDQMTPEEKISLLHGANGDPHCANQAGYIPGVPRLGIPEVFLVDGESGVNTCWDATMLPAQVGLGATFDVDAAREYGRILGKEVKDCGVHILLAPRLMVDRDCIAQFNTSNGGNYQAYGEDPVLIGKLGAAEIEGIQEDQRAIATAKQYVGSSTGTAQGAGNSVIDKQTLFEVYMKPFEDAAKAGAGAFMTSYNQVNGIWCYCHPMLHGDVLRGVWKFRGPAMNDWFCMYETKAIHNGVTMEMPGGDLYGEGQEKSYFGKALLEAAADPDSPVTQSDIDRAVGYYIGMLDRFQLLGSSRRPGTLSKEQKEESILRAREIAAKTGVLLKNDGMLPLDRKKCRNLLLVGATAKNVCCPVFKEGAYGFIDRKIGPLEAMEEACGHTIDFAYGEDLEGVPIPGRYLYTERDGKEHGVKRSIIWIEDKLEKRIRIYSLPETVKEYEAYDEKIDFEGPHALPALNKDGEQGRYYYMWSGSITAPEDGWYRISIQTAVPGQKEFEDCIESNEDMDVGLSATLNIMKEDTDYYERIASGPRLAYNGGAAPTSSVVPCHDGFNNIGADVYMKKGKCYPFFVTVTSLYYQDVQARLNWVTPSMAEENIREVEEKSRKADQVVVFAWHSSPSLEISLNNNQEAVIKAACENNRQVAVVLNSGGPVKMPWRHQVNAILEMWYPGQEGARATADLLLGKANPSGKLPVTFPERIEDMPTHDSRYPERYAEQGKIHGADAVQPNVAVFSEGLKVGYRWFDAEQIRPAYEFGFGLSYTTFAYSNMKVTPDGNHGLLVEADIRNTGQREGAEVVQCYITPPENCAPEIRTAPKQLAAFSRVVLKPGERKRVRMTIEERELSYFHVEKESDRLEEGEGWRLLRGRRKVFVGASSRDIRLTEDIVI